MTKDTLLFLVSWLVAAVAAPLSVRAFSRFWSPPRLVPIAARRRASGPDAHSRPLPRRR
jgi:hypothetical protein